MEQIYKDRYGMSFLNSPKGQKLFMCEYLSKYEQTFINMLDKNINCIETSSAGRVFDLIAAMVLDIWEYDYEGEAATLVEQHAQQYILDKRIELADIEKLICNKGTLVSRETEEILRFIELGQKSYRDDVITSIDILAHTMQIYERTDDKKYALFAFHVMLAAAVASCAYFVYKNAHADGCILSGGVFQNAILKDMTVMLLHILGVKSVYTNIATTPSDGSISLGQAYFDVTTNNEK